MAYVQNIWHFETHCIRSGQDSSMVITSSRCFVFCCSNCQYDDLVVVILGCTKPVEIGVYPLRAKHSVPLMSTDFRSTSIKSVLSRVLECIIVTDFIYPARRSPSPLLSFEDQFAFQPTGSTTSAIIQLPHPVTCLLDTNPYCTRSWLLTSLWQCLTQHTPRLKFCSVVSDFHSIAARIMQGSAIGSASYISTEYDLHPVTSGSVMDKFADDTYLVILASNNQSYSVEIAQDEKWKVGWGE